VGPAVRARPASFLGRALPAAGACISEPLPGYTQQGLTCLPPGPGQRGACFGCSHLPARPRVSGSRSGQHDCSPAVSRESFTTCAGPRSLRPEDGYQYGEPEQDRDHVKGMDAVTADPGPGTARGGAAGFADGDLGALRRQGCRAQMRRGLEECAGGAAWGEGVVAAPPAWGRAAGVGVRSVHALAPSLFGSSDCRAYLVHVSRMGGSFLTRAASSPGGFTATGPA
jgi:hypothetical protein